MFKLSIINNAWQFGIRLVFAKVNVALTFQRWYPSVELENDLPEDFWYVSDEYGDDRTSEMILRGLKDLEGMEFEEDE